MPNVELRSKTELTNIVGTENLYVQEAVTPFTVKRVTFNTIKTWILTWIYGYIYPVGSFYVQYPDAASNTDATAFPSAKRPATMFGGTWVEIFNTEGIVFQTAGYDGAGRTAGLMNDQMQGHYTSFHGSAGGSGNYPVFVGLGARSSSEISGIEEPITDGVNGAPRTGTKTSHSNRLAKYWKRTA